MNETRAHTKEEAREIFLDHIRGIVQYWNDVNLDRDQDTTKQRLEGLAFSMLVAIDGHGTILPSIDLVVRPHADDKEFLRSQGENWFEDGMVINDDCTLHDLFYQQKA